MSDLIDRQAAKHELYKMLHDCFWADDEEQDAVAVTLDNLPSVQPEPSEITDEQAILHLQSTGWMQNHDREMYESGLRERLADDSEDYDSLIPCEYAISRQAVIDTLCDWIYGVGERCVKTHCQCIRRIESIPSVDVPDTNVGDMISRQGAIDTVKRYNFIYPEYMEWFVTKLREAIKADLIEGLRKLPTVQSGIIYCKDCRYFKSTTSIHGECECGEMWQSLFGETTEVEAINVHKDHYCGYAERRTDG